MENIIQFNKSKIVATIGPASNSKEVLLELARAGVDVFRLNFSHGTHDVHKNVVSLIREINEELGIHCSILQDLQGPKIRTNEIENNGVEIKSGEELIISTEEGIIGNSKKVSTTYKSLPYDVEIGDMILVDDGKIELSVNNFNDKEVRTTVVHGGILKSRKGINLPMTAISAPSLTDKDEKDLEFGIKNDVDWIALSFVRSADDILDLKDRIKKAGKNIKVIAKVEKPEAIKNIDGIIEATDAVMVARGDLGVEVIMEEVPIIQKMIVDKCNKAAKPVIIATQMMESMIENPRPTRAETNDIANAVLDGADALMLSAETAAGKYPVQVVKSMVRTIEAVETQSEKIYNKYYDLDPGCETFHGDSLVSTACRLSQETSARALIGMTRSGYTAFKLSSHRPKANIYAFTDDRKLLTTLGLVWGVRTFYYDQSESTNTTFQHIEDLLREKALLHRGDTFINMASMPIHKEGRTNMMKINQAK